MLSYVYFGTNNLDRAIAFYNAALAPIGMERCTTGDPEWDRVAAGWGTYEDDGARELAFWIGLPLINRLLRRVTAAWSRSVRVRGKQSTTSTPPRWRTAAGAKVLPGCDFSTRAIFTQLMCVIPMATKRLPCVAGLRARVTRLACDGDHRDRCHGDG